jgi:enoyl-CoA hydratase / 3-hydroxyacyl-CoA dehydrogenase
VDEIDGVVVITLRRPEALNAISDEINNEILSVLKENADKPEVKGFVITGYGNPGFFRRRGHREVPPDLGKLRGSGTVCKGLRRCAALHGSNGETGGGGHQRHGPGGRLRDRPSLPRHGGHQERLFPVPGDHPGDSPGIGGCIVPYRKWPQGAKLFHEMICVARPINAKEALEIGMVSKVVDTIPDLIAAAVEEVKKPAGQDPENSGRQGGDSGVHPSRPSGGGQAGAEQRSGCHHHENHPGRGCGNHVCRSPGGGYNGSAEIACTEAAREGITAFLEKRRPEFKK